MDLSKFLTRWSLLSGRTRAVAAAGTAAAILALLAASFAARPQRVQLFASPLHPEQLAEVQERLAAWNVPFTPLADNVSIDTGRRNDVLLKLSMAGVPHAHVDASSDVLAKIGALTPQSVIDAQTRDGLAGDIALALRGIDGVQDARVIVAPAKPGYFADEQSREASASVRLRMSGTAPLQPDAVSGIRAFVAASVPGLDARNVTILDDRGIALGEANAAEGGGDLQRSLQSALDAALGAGTSIVRVHVEYDGRRLQRIGAAIILDAQRNADLVQIRDLAAATLGLQQTRGDRLDVESVPFAHQLVAKKDVWWLAYGAIVPLLPTAAIAATLLVALRLSREPLQAIVKSVLGRAALAHAAKAVRGAEPSAVRGALRDEPPHAAAAIISALPAATAAAVLDMYPAAERAAIVARMQRPHSPLLPDAERFIANA